MQCPNTTHSGGFFMKLEKFESDVATFKCGRCGGTFTITCGYERLPMLITGDEE